MDEKIELFNDIKGIIQEIDSFDWKTRKDKRQAKHIIKKLYELEERYEDCELEKRKVLKNE